jgi:hypothetical protein
MMRALFLSYAIVCAACGATGDAGGGASNLPVSGTGPFRPLVEKDGDVIDAPVVLLDPGADLDDPWAIADGDAIGLWLTARRRVGTETVTRIEHADSTSLRKGFGELTPVLEADQPWEAGSVWGPAILVGDPWLLFYRAANAIGWATSSDGGHTWQKAMMPALVHDGEPAAVVRVGDTVRLYLPGAGGLFAAEASFADLVAHRSQSWLLVDAEPETPEWRDPHLRVPPFAISVGRPFARVAPTVAGRLRWDLYFTVLLPSTSTPSAPTSSAGFAASYEPSIEGTSFETYPTPILSPREVGRSPAMIPYQGGAILFYIQRTGVRDAVLAGQSP